MRSLILLAILTFFISTSYAQTNTFLTQFSKTTESPFIYTIGQNPNVLKGISKQIERDEMFNNRKYEAGKILLSDILILTKEEKEYILNELQKQSDTNLWNQLKIPNSKLIPLDTLTAISKDSTKGWNYFIKVYGKTLYNFSIPIFFRNNQFCLFYYNTNCGIRCGQETLAVYKYTHGKWTKWITISESETSSIQKANPSCRTSSGQLTQTKTDTPPSIKFSL